MTVQEILTQVEKELTTKQEREYFHIHVERYRVILEKIRSLEATKVRSSTSSLRHSATSQLRILDVGCFPYHLGRALELMGHDVYGISSGHEPIKNKNIKVVNIESEKFSWKNDTFDLVIFTEVLEHIPQAPLLAIKEMHRVTKLDGHVLVTTPNIARSINRGKLAAGKSIMYPVSDLFANEGKGSVIYMRHNREYTMDELKKIVEGGSWIVESAEYFVSYTPFRKRTRGDNPILWTGKFLNYLVMLAIPSLRDTLLVIGKKS